MKKRGHPKTVIIILILAALAFIVIGVRQTVVNKGTPMGAVTGTQV